MARLTEQEWRLVFSARCKSKRGERLSDEEMDLITRAFKDDARRYGAMSADVFDATVPVGSSARAKR